MTRGQRAVVSSAVLVLAVLGSAALVFHDRIHERWLIWRLEHGEPEQATEAATALGAMGSLRAIEPLAARIDTPFPAWRSRTHDPAVEFCSALFAIVIQRREATLPYLLAATSEDLSPKARNAIHQLADVARGNRDNVELDPYWIQASPDDGDSPSPPDRGGE